MTLEKYKHATVSELQKLVEHYKLFAEELRKEKIEEKNINYSWARNLGHWYWNPSANIVEFNPLKAQSLGYTCDELPEKVNIEFFTEKIHHDDIDRYKTIMHNHLNGKLPLHEIEYRIRRKDGVYKWFYQKGKVTRRDSDGNPLFFAGIVFDISEKRETELKLNMTVKQLKDEIEVKDQFIALLAHDLRNPIGLLKNFSDLLLEDITKYSKKEIIEKLSFINDLSNNTFNLLENLILWLKTHNGNIKFNGTDCEILKILKESKSSVKNQAEIKNIDIQVKSTNNIEVYTDPNILCTVIRNLLSNAIKYSYEGGVIELISKEMDNNLIVEINDFGIGINQNKLNSILEAGINNESIRGTKGEKGTGIGLNLCKSLVKELNGKIWGESEVNKGTKMYVSIPLSTKNSVTQ